ncbi:MAG: NAD-dependent epimerase/dehydratase family protein [Planctomycetota bacterium]|jgi:dihydroflavonol-4-reductase
MSDERGKVLVTGGAGFIGSHLVGQLVAEERAVRVLEKPGAPTAHLPQDDIEIVFADIRDAQAVAQAAQGCDVVLHLAANPNLWARDPGEFEQVNHQGTRNVLAAARAAGARRTVHVSTESILAPSRSKGVITEDTRTSLDDMLGPYCRSKWLAEQAAAEAAEAGDPVVIVRPSIPVGPGDRHMGPPSRMICDFCNGRVKGHLDGDLNFIDARDVAAGIWAAAQRGEIGRRYLLVKENWTILELLRFLSEVTGRPVPRWRVPYFVAISFARVEEFFCRRVTGKLPMATVTGVQLTQRPFQFDGRQSARDLGLPAMRSCRESIVESVRWFQSSGHARADQPLTPSDSPSRTSPSA